MHEGMLDVEILGIMKHGDLFQLLPVLLRISVLIVAARVARRGGDGNGVKRDGGVGVARAVEGCSGRLCCHVCSEGEDEMRGWSLLQEGTRRRIDEETRRPNPKGKDQLGKSKTTKNARLCSWQRNFGIGFEVLAVDSSGPS